MIVGFFILCYPILIVNRGYMLEQNIANSVLNVFVSLLLQVLAVAYRFILLKILPSRYASTRHSESHFIVITTIAFNFFFYIITPTIFYAIVERIPKNDKLKQFFAAVIIVLIMTVIICILDLKYRMYNRKIKNMFSSWTKWCRFCQTRLHD
jgi:hypothetical protein